MKHQNYPYNSNIEKWKYTNINQFDSYGFNFQPVDKKINIRCKKNEILLYNGRLYSFGEDLINNKVLVSDINDAIKNNQNNLKKIFNTIFLKNQENHFKIKDESLDIGFFLYIPNNLIQTISIINIIDQGNQKNFLNSRNFIHIGRSSTPMNG